jgi:hypothetical protein
MSSHSNQQVLLAAGARSAVTLPARSLRHLLMGEVVQVFHRPDEPGP